jgi:hypothetical protein
MKRKAMMSDLHKKKSGTCFALLFLLAAVASLSLFAAAATAAELHVSSGSFGEPGSGNGQLDLGEHSGIAVNMTTGDVYVADTDNHRVEEFESDGTFVRTFAPAGEPSFNPTFLAVDTSGGPDDGDLYVMDSSTTSVFKFEADGTQVVSGWGAAGRLAVAESEAVAVGPDGDLFVGDGEHIARYEPSGSPLTGFHTVVPASVGLAADPEGNLYMSHSATIWKYSDSGQELGEERIAGGQTTAIATDPVDGDLYLYSDQGSIFSYAPNCGARCGPGQAKEVFASGELSNPQGIGVGPGHVVYVADASNSTIAVYGVETVEPPTVSIEPPTSITATSAHVSGRINPNAPVGDPPNYAVHWTFTCREKETTSLVACGEVKGELPSDSLDHVVEGTVEHLSPGTEYEVRLVAENAARENTQEPGVSFPTLAAPPTVREVFATGVTMTEATFGARELNPHGAETTYFFEYVPLPAFEEGGFANAGGSNPAALPAGTRGVTVSSRVAGLMANTDYVYRLVASNEKGPIGSSEGSFMTQALTLLPGSGCPNEIFRIGPSALLPDCRAYEQASPIDKAGQNAAGFPDVTVSAPDGSSVLFIDTGGTGIPAGGGGRQDLTTMLASRSGESWSAERLLPPEADGTKAWFLGASENLHYALVEAGSEAELSLYLIDTASESVQQLVHSREGGAETFADDAISESGSWVYFESRARLEGVSGANHNCNPLACDNLYRWDAASGEVSVVGLLPAAEKGKAPAGGSFGAAYEWRIPAETDEGGAMADLYVEAVHATPSEGSELGDQIYFTAGVTGQLYLRRGLAGENPTTVRVSKPAVGASPAGEHPAAFQEATPDGSRAFLLSSEKLTSDATTGPSEEGKDIYRWDAGTEELVDVTPDPSEEASGGARVQGLLGASDDGTSGYLVALGVLASNMNSEGDGAVSGANNIYRFEEEGGGGFQLTFVAGLTAEPGDTYNWSPGSYVGRSGLSSYQGKSSRVTPDGGELVFTSMGKITNYDNRGCGEEGEAFGPCKEIYMYSAAQERVMCLSCDPSGSRPAGDAELKGENIASNSFLAPSVAPASRLTRNVSEDGSRVFFQTPDSLVAADENGPPDCSYLSHKIHQPRELPTCLDTYMWEAPGAPGGSCRVSEVNGGCLYLLSTGTSKDPSYFVDASADGSNAFIATTSQLVPTDDDELFDIYDVHTGGGLVSQQNVPGIPCSGEACRGATEGVTGAPAPATSSFQGPGNPKSTTHRKSSCKKKKKSKACQKQKHKASSHGHRKGSKKHRKGSKGAQGGSKAGSSKGGGK